MARELAARLPHGGRGPASRVSPRAGMALFAATAGFWLATTQPWEVFRLLGSDAPLRVQEWAVLCSSVLGLLVLLAAFFGIAVYALHIPAINTRETRRMIVEVRAQLLQARVRLGALQEERARLEARFAVLRRLRAEIALYEAVLLRTDQDDALRAGRMVSNGREVVDDILSELEAAGVSHGRD
jgi:hypothetical protein